MALIKVISETNSIQIYRGSPLKSTQYEIGDRKEGGYSEIKKNGTVKGIALHNAMDKKQLIGYRAEELFAEFLGNSKIAYLYIGQAPSGLELSDTLNQRYNAQRPDFLVSVQDGGNQFIDVKARTKKRFNLDGESFFVIYHNELERLENLQLRVNQPVWLALIATEHVDEGRVNKSFYMSPLRLLQNFVSKIKEGLSLEAFDRGFPLRIPYELLYPMDSRYRIESSDRDLCPKMIDENLDGYSQLITDLANAILFAVKSDRLFKSHVANRVLNDNPNIRVYSSHKEIDLVLNILIANGELKYEASKPLIAL